MSCSSEESKIEHNIWGAVSTELCKGAQKMTNSECGKPIADKSFFGPCQPWRYTRLSYKSVTDFWVHTEVPLKIGSCRFQQNQGLGSAAEISCRMWMFPRLTKWKTSADSSTTYGEPDASSVPCCRRQGQAEGLRACALHGTGPGFSFKAAPVWENWDSRSAKVTNC